LETTEQARAIIEKVGARNLKIMFDCYHVARTEGDLLTRLKDLGDLVGHIQFASVPDRGAPDHGEINYPWLFEQIAKLGWQIPLGAEYKPGTQATDDTLGWLA
jgi:hydroxypyruvate isomerase